MTGLSNYFHTTPQTLIFKSYRLKIKDMMMMMMMMMTILM